MLCPSGLTSSEIQVPLVAVNSAFRADSSGRGFLGGPPPAPPAPGPWATNDAGIARTTPNAYASFMTWFLIPVRRTELSIVN